MESLPSSIEVYLREAGLSGTEVLIIKRLLEGEPLTIRQLAAKTGKSIGLLDQAMKKLLKKRIVNREIINDAPKYVLHSLESIAHWVEEDTEGKREMLKRKQENFEAFISSLDVQQGSRPDIQHFSGLEGIVQAYRKVLEAGKEQLLYVPVKWKEEEDPLRDFRVQYFRDRRRLGVFCRVITHNTPLGRRFQSRDSFEYRQTICLSEEECPLSFEKVIAGDQVLCIDHEKQAACLLRYPELAKHEAFVFEILWRKGQSSPVLQSVTDHAPVVPIKTRLLSQVREFFLSRRSLVAFAMCAFLAAGLTYGLYRHNVHLNVQRIRERVTSIAATGALQFDAEDLRDIRQPADSQKDVYRGIVKTLGEIRSQNEQIRYAYILWPRENSYTFEFIADADSIYPYAKIDINGDGVIDTEDALISPGDPYDILEMDVLRNRQYSRPTANSVPYTDQWGTFLTGYAPIKDSNGKIEAILGIDIDASNIYELTRSNFAMVTSFIGFFLLFVFIRLAAFKRPLLYELWKLFRQKTASPFLIFCSLLSLIFIISFYNYTLHLLKEETGSRLMSIAATSALQIDPQDLEPLRLPKDMYLEEYQRVFQILNNIRDQSSDIKYAYIWRPTEQPGIWEFIVDADSNYNIPFLEQDFNNDGSLTDADENLAPGVRYDISFSSPIIYRDGLKRPLFDTNFVVDQWGTFLTGTAPIYGQDGRSIAVLGIDMDVSKLFAQINKKFSPWFWFSGAIIVLFLVKLIFVLHLKYFKTNN